VKLICRCNSRPCTLGHCQMIMRQLKIGPLCGEHAQLHPIFRLAATSKRTQQSQHPRLQMLGHAGACWRSSLGASKCRCDLLLQHTRAQPGVHNPQGLLARVALPEAQSSRSRFGFGFASWRSDCNWPVIWTSTPRLNFSRASMSRP
jgi:hypothetical protein